VDTNDSGVTSFTLWTPRTAIGLYSAGGDLSPGATVDSQQNDGVGIYPGTLIAEAASGNMYFSKTEDKFPIELAPSPVGQLSLLAAGSIYGEGAVIAMSGADMNSLATPAHPVFASPDLSNANQSSAYLGVSPLSPIAFGPDTPTTNL